MTLTPRISIGPDDHVRRMLLRTGAGLVAAGAAPVAVRGEISRSTSDADASLFDFLPADVREAIQRGNSKIDVSDELRRALAALAPVGGTLWIPAGQYRLNQPIELPRRVRLQGAGSHASTFQIGHESHAFRSVAPVNAATAVHVALADLGIVCLDNRASRGAGYYDTGGTHVDLQGVLISGFRYGCVFDQTEIATIDRCQLQFAREANLWIVNGPDLEAGALTGYTNRITVTRCQIDQSDGYGVLDDGGRGHSYRDNNFNGCRKGHLRIAGFGEYVVDGNDFEGAGGACLTLSNHSLSGRNVEGPNFVSVTGNLFVATVGHHAIICEGVTALSLVANCLSGEGASSMQGLNTVETLSSSANAVRNPDGFFDGTRARQRQVSDDLRLDHFRLVEVPEIAPGDVHAIRVDLPAVRAGDMALASFEPPLPFAYALSPVIGTSEIVVPLLNPGQRPSSAYRGLLRIKIFQA